MRNITIQNKKYALHDKINKITSAANQNQHVHRIIETSSFMSLLRAQLVANISELYRSLLIFMVSLYGQ